MSTIPSRETKSNPVADSRITIEQIKVINKGNLAAFATVNVAGRIKIHSVRVVQQPGGLPWVAMPTTEVPAKNQGDKRKFFPTLEILDPELKSEISDAVLRAYALTIAGPSHSNGGNHPVRANIPAEDRF